LSNENFFSNPYDTDSWDSLRDKLKLVVKQREEKSKANEASAGDFFAYTEFTEQIKKDLIETADNIEGWIEIHNKLLKTKENDLAET